MRFIPPYTGFRGLPLFIALMLVVAGAVPALARQVGPKVPASPPVKVSAAAELGAARPNFDNRGALESYLDGLISGYMRRDHIAGVAVSIVRGGQVVMAKGYGIAATGPERPVSPDTLFRVGSISKVFTWISLLQLAEAGRLSLDDPVNAHLPPALRLKDNQWPPVLIRHLMNHTAGFEDTALGHLIRLDPRRALPMIPYLARYRPARVRAPGRLTAYSNYGAALAGAIVAGVSGEPFEDYAQKHILGPLGMTGSSFREVRAGARRPGLAAPMAAPLAARLSRGFRWQDGAFRANPGELIGHMASAGAAASTAADMGRFMIAWLDMFQNNDQPILGRDGAALTRRRSFTNAKALPGFANGFMEYSLPGGWRGVGHGGATLDFKANLVMVPGLDLGLFIVANTGAGGRLTNSFPKAFMERFFAAAGPGLPGPVDMTDGALDRFAGTYMTTRRSYSGLEKLAVIGSGVLRVTPVGKGALVLSSGAEAVRYVAVGPTLFRRDGGPDLIAFEADKAGRIVRLLGPGPVATAERIGFVAGPGWLMLMFGLAFLVAAGLLVRAFVSIRIGGRAPAAGERRLYLAAAAWLSFVIVFAGALVRLSASGIGALIHFPGPWLQLSLWVALLAIAATLAAAGGLHTVIRDQDRTVKQRLFYGAWVLVFSVFAATLYGWNVVGFRYF